MKQMCMVIHNFYWNNNLISPPDDWQWVLTDSLAQVDPQTRSRAIEALPAFCEHYFKDDSGAVLARQAPLIHHYVSQLSSPTQTTRMGFSLAIGMM
jgi:hypothetical protein